MVYDCSLICLKITLHICFAMFALLAMPVSVEYHIFFMIISNPGFKWKMPVLGPRRLQEFAPINLCQEELLQRWTM